MEKVDVLGIKVDNVTMAEALKKADDIVKTGKPEYLTIVSLYQLLLCKEDERMFDFANHAGLSIVESTNVIRLSKRLGTPLK